MNIRFLLVWIASAAFVIMCAACAGAESSTEISFFDEIVMPGENPAENPEEPEETLNSSLEEIAASLERLAEIERDMGFFPGMGLVESELREGAGDYAGAAVAVFKEVSWAYGHGFASMDQVEESLHRLLDLFEDSAFQGIPPGPQRTAAVRAVRGCIAFVRGDWEKAEELLTGILSPYDGPDSFLRWMLLVCVLEQNKGGDEERAARFAYGAMRARYMTFPEYWYRGVRNIGIDYAEYCINISPQGPFAGECRDSLAEHFGISHDGKNIRTRFEIESIIRASVSANNPKMLEELFPLIALPDNPYTIYAVGAMQALSSRPEFRTFFAEQAFKASGRLAERLNFISRG